MKETPHQLFLGLSTPPKPTLDNFVVGKNAEALAAIHEFLQGKGPQFLYLWGSHGCGCTHIVSSVALDTTGRVPTFKEAVTLYAVDDVQDLNATEQEELFTLMNSVRAHPQSRLLVAGHAPVHELELRNDIRSRLSWGLNFELQYLDDESAAKEFVRQALERGIELDKDVQHWIGIHCPRDMRSLRSLLDGIDRYAMEKKRKVTLPLVLEFTRNGGQE